MYNKNVQHTTCFKKRICFDNFKILSSFPFFVVLFIIKGFDLEVTNIGSLTALAISGLLALPSLIEKRFSNKALCLYLLLFTIGFLNLFVGQSLTFLFLALALLIGYKEDYKKILNIAFYVFSFCFITKIFLSSVGILDNNPVFIYRNGIGFKPRYAFGYSHPNICHLMFFLCSMLYLYKSKFHGNNFIKVLILILFDSLLFYFTTSRTGFIISLCSYFFYLFLCYSHLFRDFLRHYFRLILIFIFALPFIFGFLYGKVDFVYSIDSLLTGRIRYISILFNDFNFPLIGSDIYNETVIFDNGIISLLYESGFFGFILFLYLYFYTSLTASKKDLLLLFILICIAVYGLTEGFFQSITINMFLFSFLLVINNSGKNIMSPKRK